MKIKSIGIVLGSALAAALLVSGFDRNFGLMVFVGVATSMTVGEVLAHRRQREVEANLSQSEETVSEVLLSMRTTLTEAQSLGDASLIAAVTASLASAEALLTDIREFKAELA